MARTRPFSPSYEGPSRKSENSGASNFPGDGLQGVEISRSFPSDWRVKHNENDPHFWNDLFEKLDVEFPFLLFNAILGAVAIRVRFVRDSLISRIVICDSLPSLGFERDL